MAVVTTASAPWSRFNRRGWSKFGRRQQAQYDTYRPFPDLAVNGQQTLSENLSDLAGLAAAHDALVSAQAPMPLSVEADREFFIGYAACWRGIAREAAERRQLVSGGHAPARYRAATVRNLDPWYRAFDVQPGQKQYLAPGERVRIW